MRHGAASVPVQGTSGKCSPCQTETAFRGREVVYIPELGAPKLGVIEHVLGAHVHIRWSKTETQILPLWLNSLTLLNKARKLNPPTDGKRYNEYLGKWDLGEGDTSGRPVSYAVRH
jgi:hypothetical protein